MPWIDSDNHTTDPYVGELAGVGSVVVGEIPDNSLAFLFKFVVHIDEEDRNAFLDIISIVDIQAAAMLMVMIEDQAKRLGLDASLTAAIDQMRSTLKDRLKEKDM